MRDGTERYRVELDVETEARGPMVRAGRGDPSASRGPFCIALLGDFSGRSSRGVVEDRRALSERRAVRVDRDSVDAAIGSFSPELHLTVGASPLTLRFSELDDFHPDRLYERVPQFQALRSGAALVNGPGLPPAEPRQVIGAPSGRPAALHGGNLLDEILGDAPQPPGGAAALPPAPPVRTRAEGDLDELVRRAVQPHILPDEDPARRALGKRADDAVSNAMRMLLHDPAFQRLESLWRGVSFLVRRLETDENLRVYLMDVTREELAADLATDARDDETAIHRVLVESSVGTAGAARWALIVGDYTFGPDLQDVELLARIGRIARAAGAPFVAAASSRLVGAPSFGGATDPDDWEREPAPRWNELRQDAVARWLGLVAPRFLLRAPYGKATDECERISFEECDGAGSAPEHEHYLWGNPALVCAQLLGEAYARSGWDLRPRRELGGLPLHVYRTVDGPVATPCAEALLFERALEQMLEDGIMPLASIKESDAVRLVRIQSIARPLAPLAGAWA